MSELKWNDKEVAMAVEKAVVGALNEYGAKMETVAKSRVKAGAGVLTGTYRRSVRTAKKGHSWKSDNVKPSPSTPERGGKGGASRAGNTITIEFGSGMAYAMVLERKYSPILTGFKAVSSELPKIIEKHAKKAGLT